MKPQAQHDQIPIRFAEPGDMSFIYSTWINSYRYYSPLGKSCRNDIFFDNYKRVIDLILTAETTKTIVAHVAEAPDVILSYLVYQPGTLHYIFTKGAFMRLGIATALFHHAFGPTERVEYTHKTFMSGSILEGSHYDSFLTFNPFHLYKLGDHYGEKEF